MFQHREHDAFQFIEPSVPAKPAVPTAAVQPLPSVPAPMDVSDAGHEAFSKALLNVQDIDANDKENPQLVSEYVNDIYEYMRKLEVSFSCLCFIELFFKKSFLQNFLVHKIPRIIICRG